MVVLKFMSLADKQTLALPKRQILDPSKLKGLADDSFKFD